MNANNDDFIERIFGKALTADDFSAKASSEVPRTLKLDFFGSPLDLDPDFSEYNTEGMLGFEFDGGGYCLTIEKTDGTAFDLKIGEVAAFTLYAFGPKENVGLVEALVELGRKLEPLAVARRRWQAQ